MTYTPEQLKLALRKGQFLEQLSCVYGTDSAVLQAATERYIGAVEDFVSTFPQHQNSPLMLFQHLAVQKSAVIIRIINMAECWPQA